MNNTIVLVLVTLFIVITLGLQWWPMIKARRMRGQPAPTLDAVLDDDQQGLKRYLLYFWAPSCGMCRTMTPVINRLAEAHREVVAVDASAHLDLTRACGVMGTPALVLIEDGRIKRMQLGARSEAQIRSWLE